MSELILTGFPELCELSHADAKALHPFLQFRVYERGRRLASEATEADGLLLVERGRVQLKTSTLGQSESFDGPVAMGAYSLVCVGQRRYTAIAETPCFVWLLDRPAYRRLVEDHPRVACRLLEGLLVRAAGLGEGLIATLQADRPS